MRKKLTQVLGTCLVLVIFVAIVLSHQPVGPTGTKAALLHDETVSKSIRSILSQYATTMVGGNVKNWLALWDDEATWLPSGGPASVGKASIEHAFRASMMQSPLAGMSISVRDVRTDGAIAVAIGDFTESRGFPSGGAHTEGKFLTVFRKQPDGTWRIFQSCFNFNTPPAPPPAPRDRARRGRGRGPAARGCRGPWIRAIRAGTDRLSA